VNFVNISIAEASGRVKEIGVRKVFGALKRNLVKQFLAEAFIINLIAFFISIVIVNIALPFYGSLVGKQLTVFLYSHLLFYLLFFLVFVVGTLLSGIYPAFILSSFNPLKVLKGEIFALRDKGSFKKGLVIIQLTATTVLIISVLVIFKQINYIRSKELGFNKNNIIVVHAPRSLNHDTTKTTKYQTFKARLLANSNIEAVTSTYFIPGMEQVFDSRFTSFDNKPVDEIILKNNTIEQDFIKVFKINLLAGNNFSEITGANRNKIIINESVLPHLGLKTPDEVIGHVLKTSNNQNWTIVGVYSDFHQESLHSGIKPAIYFYGHPVDFGNYSIRISPHKMKETIGIIEKEWTAIYPYDPFDYVFEDLYIDNLYKQDLHFGQLIIIFTVLSVFIASLGLLGLIMIISAKNTKSIGIRRVSGATVTEIIFLLTKSFLKWVSIAFLIAVPLGYFIMEKWLENFAYRTEISWWIFLITGLLTLLITTSTVLWQTWQAATRNPVEALRSE
jgi:putative ABC transport system permease protein